MIGRIVRRIGLASMVLVTLVLAHDLAFLAAYGRAFETVLVRTGHDERWAAAVLMVLGLGIGLAVAGFWRLYRLDRYARDLEAATGTAGRLRPDLLLGHVIHLWPRIGLAATALFVLQENLEHLMSGGPLSGLAVLGSAGSASATNPSDAPPPALAIIALVAFAVAVVGALYRWRTNELAARIAHAVRAWLRRRDGVIHREPRDASVRLGSVIGRGLAVRAPPLRATN